MKIICSQDELLAKLQIAARGVSQRSTVQILSGVLIRAAADGAELASTDMEISLRVPLDVRVDEPGDVVLPGRLLLDIVRALPAEDVTIDQPGGTGAAQIECGPSRYSLATQSAEDFPQLPMPAGSSFTVDREAFVDTVAHVGRAASKDESRPVLTGILVQFAAGRLTMAATDSYRLAVKETELNSKAPDLEAIVPGRALTELARIATAGDTIDVGVHDNQVVFGTEGIWLTSRRIDGQFPNYRQLLPEQFEHELTLPRAELLEVVRRAAVMIQRATPLQLRFAEGELTVIARTHDVGESHESMPVGFSGDTLEIGFNADFLRDGLESMDGDDGRLKRFSPLRPGVIQGEGDDFTYLVMPSRLPG